jgi:ferrous iron transport protein A
MGGVARENRALSLRSRPATTSRHDRLRQRGDIPKPFDPGQVRTIRIANRLVVTMNTAPCANLADLPDGTEAVVAGLHAAVPGADSALLRRLAEIGFVAGEPVQVLRRGPGGREPLAVQVGDTLFALRLLEARCVQVEGIAATVNASVGRDV